MIFRVGMVVGLLLSLNACVVIPGSELSTSGKTIETVEAEDVDINQYAVVSAITPQLLAQLGQQDQSQLYDNYIPTKSVSGYQYRIGKGDTLNISVWNSSVAGARTSLPSIAGGVGEGNAAYVVDGSGNIYYPLVGKVSVQGKTVSQVRSTLTARLSHYLKNPQLGVDVTDFRSQQVSVVGSVRNSQRLPITNVPLTLLDAISQAGGFTEEADTNNVRWTHKGQTYTISLQDVIRRGDNSKNPVLSGGDSVYVAPRDDMRVYVMGEVGQQQDLTFGNNGLNLTEALGKSRGMDQEIANASGVFVIRREPEKNPEKPIHIYQLDLADATAYALGTEFQLKPEDVVFVTAAPVSLWSRVLTKILPSANAVRAAAQ